MQALSELHENITHCWRCTHCRWVPSPLSNEFAHACPSVQFGEFHAFSGGGKVVTAHALATGEAGYSDIMLKSVFACTMCGACDVSCKINNGEMVEPLDILYALRAKIADDGMSLPEHRALLANLRREGNPYGRSAAERSRWAEGLGIRDALREPVDVLLHIGCDSSYDPALWAELHAIVALLNKAGVRFGIAGTQERSSGELAYDLGFRDDARTLASALGQVIKAVGAPTVVTCSAGSYSAFRNIWPRLGVDVGATRVQHVTEFIDGLFEQGALVLDGGFAGTVTYHDPCKLGRLSEVYTPARNSWTRVLNTMKVHADPKPVLFGNDGLYEAPRRLLQRLAGVNLVEMERNRVGSYCCGAKAGAADAYPDFAESAAGHRLDEAAATGAEVIATSCGGCRRHLASVAQAQGRPVRVAGIFELLSSASM